MYNKLKQTFIAALVAGFSLLSCNSLQAQEKKETTTSPVAIQENKNAGVFKFEELEYNFGTIKQGEQVFHDFVFTNAGKEPIIITKAEGSCHCTVPEYPKEPIKKGQTAVIKVKFDSAGKQGIQDKLVTITSNATVNPLVLHLKGTVDVPPMANEVK